MTSVAVHTDQAPRVYAARHRVLDEAFVAAHPERFTRHHPAPPALPLQVGINLRRSQCLDASVEHVGWGEEGQGGTRTKWGQELC